MLSRYSLGFFTLLCSLGLAACQPHQSRAADAADNAGDDKATASAQADSSPPPSPQQANQSAPTNAESQPSQPTASGMAAGPEPVLGTDYDAIEGGQPFAPMKDRIEVVEVFGYVCPACFAVQSAISSWEAGLPSDVHFVLVPALFGGPWDTYARAFYAAETLGLVTKTHAALFHAIHVDHTLNGEQGNDSEQDIAKFYAHYTVSETQFINTMHSFGVDARLNHAKEFARRSKIAGTPSLIINGKYLVKGHSFDDMMRIADHLIARERNVMHHPAAH